MYRKAIAALAVAASIAAAGTGRAGDNSGIATDPGTAIRNVFAQYGVPGTNHVFSFDYTTGDSLPPITTNSGDGPVVVQHRQRRRLVVGRAAARRPFARRNQQPRSTATSASQPSPSDIARTCYALRLPLRQHDIARAKPAAKAAGGRLTAGRPDTRTAKGRISDAVDAARD